MQRGCDADATPSAHGGTLSDLVRLASGHRKGSNRNQVNTKATTGDHSALTIGYPCTGTHTYRIITDGYADGTAYSDSVQSENYLRVTCHS
jgi:hypothetical protein